MTAKRAPQRLNRHELAKLAASIRDSTASDLAKREAADALIYRIETFKLNRAFDRRRFLIACGLLSDDA